MDQEPMMTCVVRPREMKPGPIKISNYPIGARSDFNLPLYEGATGIAIQVPFIVCRGKKPGPVLGITAAVHGNELNGVRIIQNLLAVTDVEKLSGTLLCAPIVNVPAFNAGTRRFSDGMDLNHFFPGKVDGQPVEQYARSFIRTFVKPLDYLIDLHTASEGRINTMYVRTDWHSPEARAMAKGVNPEIILHSAGGDGTLRAAVRRKNIPAITVEAGDPSVIQGKMVSEGEIGIRNVMIQLGMLKGEIKTSREPVVCKSSKWLRTTGGGILQTYFKLFDRVEKRQLLARTTDAFGQVLQEYHAPEAGIVIGMAENPLAIPGTRFCHLGIVGNPRKSPTKKSSS